MRWSLVLAFSTILLLPNLGFSNLLTNESFESGQTGWTFNTSANGVNVVCNPPTSNPVEDGSCAAYKNVFDPSASISQTITTTVGQTYLIDVWLAINCCASGDVSVSFGGVQGYDYLSTTDPTPNHYTEHSFTSIASSSSTALLFAGTASGGTFFIDNVSVTAVATPEPVYRVPLGALLLCFLGLRWSGWHRERVVRIVPM